MNDTGVERNAAPIRLPATEEAANFFGKVTSAVARGMSFESILMLQAELPPVEEGVLPTTITGTSLEM